MAKVTLYTTVKKKDGIDIDFPGFLKAVRSGRDGWKQKTLKCRDIQAAYDLCEDAEKKAILKQQKRKYKADNIPAVTISGTFEGGHSFTNLQDHSGLIAMDFDDLDNLQQAFNKLKADKYTRALFRSVSGSGLCAVVRITPSKHSQSFEGLDRYYTKQYGLVVDQACKDINRLRFISYDEDLFYNSSSEIFKDYPKKKKGRKNKPQNYTFTDHNDFEYVLGQIQDGHVDLTKNYDEWVNIAFAIQSKYGAAGEQYFHAISQYYSGYDEKLCARKYRSCKNPRKITLGTFYHYSEQAGLDIKTPESRTIARIGKYTAQRGDSMKIAQKQLVEMDHIPPERSKEILEKIDQADLSDIKDIDKDENPITKITDYLRHNNNLIYNEITMKVYDNNNELDDRELNSIVNDTQENVDKASRNKIESIIFSNRTKSVNPVHDFFKDNAAKQPKHTIQALADAIESPSGMTGDNFMPNYKEHFIRKWAVGAVAMWHGRMSELMLVLTGDEQGTGKTHFFRYLLPDELQMYFAEINMDGSKDERILMCNKIMLLNDEMSEASQADMATVKELCSKQWINVRRPYGKANEDLRRLAVFCGTSNNSEILRDPTGNRRLIPIEVTDIPQEAYNNIDKIDFWMEAYHQWKAGYNYKLSKEDVKLLRDNTGDHEQPSPERELIMKYFKPPENWNDGQKKMTNTDIKDYLEDRSNQKLSKRKLGMELKSLGFEKKVVRDGEKTPQMYSLDKCLGAETKIPNNFYIN
jgi:predicted P-loop ATPase